MLVIGSYALRCYDRDRSVKDIDIAATREEAEWFIATQLSLPVSDLLITDNGHSISVRQGKRLLYEFFIATNENSWGKYAKLQGAYNTKELVVATKEVLFSVKCSHIHMPTKLVKFRKHIQDYQWLLEQVGSDTLSEITTEHFKHNEEVAGRKLKTPKLAKDSQKFFKESSGPVEYRFIHDDIHDIMAHYAKPLYTRMQWKGTKSAMCHKVLWDEFSFEDKCRTVLEEAYVIALERKLIPYHFDKTKQEWQPETALDWSLMRICTNLCSGWFRQFACDNYKQIREFINPKYHVRFFQAYNRGEIEEGGGKLIQE